MQKPTFKLLLTFFLFCLSLGSFAQEESSGSKQDTIAIIQSLNNKAIEAIQKQRFETILPDLLQAKEYATRINSPKQKAKVSTTLAYLYYKLESYDLARTEAAMAISYVKGQENSIELGQAYNLFGIILVKRKDYNDAIKYLERADNIFLELNKESELAKAKFNKGLLAYEKGEIEMALNYYTASLPVFESMEMPYYEAFANKNLARALLELTNENEEEKQTNITNAKEAIEKAISISRSNGYLDLETDCYKVQSRLFLMENKPEEAYKTLNNYVTVKDSLQNIHTKILNQNVNFESNDADLNAIIATQQSDLDEQQKSIIMNRFTTGLSVALIAILSLLTLSLYKNNNLRAKANNLLQEKNNELLIAKEKAEKASLAKAQFLSTITHELRTPMYAVTGLTHLLLEENPREDQKEHLNSLKFSGEYLLSLINNILDLNKLEANKVEIEKTSFSLKKRAEDVLIALKKSANDKNNKLTLDFDDSIPSKLLGDPIKISQILINLIGNSVKFTENGEVTLRIKKLSQTDNTVMLHFEVVDTGVGISLKKQKSIFENFTQGSVQINRKFGGTGLGLSIVKNLLNLLNSKIHLESEIGKGSKFWFDMNFPIAEDAVEVRSSSNVDLKVDYSALEGLHILVVEDNKINQMITKKILEKNKLQCSVADNGEDAVSLVKTNNYDLVLMDIHMPGISGIEATQQIREFKKELPIIALTAVTIDENLDDFYKAGFNEIIPKPFKTEEFFEKIHRTFQAQNI